MTHSNEKSVAATRPQSILRRFGRILDGLAIAMIAAPLGTALIVANDGLRPIRGGCATTTENEVLALGLLYFAVKFGWKILKALNDFIDPFLPNHVPEPKPQPLDDF